MKTLIRTFASAALVLAISATGVLAQTEETPIRKRDQQRIQLQDQDGTMNQVQARNATQRAERQALRTQRQEEANQFRTAFRATLSEEQLAILENKEMTREQKREALMASLSEAQREMFQAQQQLRAEQGFQYREGMKGEQANQARNRAQQSGECLNNEALQQQVREQIRQQSSGSGSGGRYGKGGN
ncbi:hypothetical protein [Gaoshiqia sp. Z1-71]|uniref:hypothetical protein n=1 Tax=Gaoshiqia hydrogeniformans TaxID=3290090 RepID=UPI003BF84DDE